MWLKIRNGARKALLSVLLLCSLRPPLFSASDGVTLTQSQVAEIKNELNAMRNETLLLRSLSEELKADSEKWREKCTRLEERLARALQELGSSEKTVLELQEEVGTLRLLLEELRAEFAALNKSYSRQKKKTSFWRTATIVSILAAITEGGIIWLSK